jgi:hypothetical protein
MHPRSDLFLNGWLSSHVAYYKYEPYLMVVLTAHRTCVAHHLCDHIKCVQNTK